LSRYQQILIGLLAIYLLAITPVFISAWKKTPKNMIGISYGGGPVESAHFQGIIQPGSKLFYNGLFNQLYLYPADQQNYIVSLNPRVGATRGKDSIIAPTSDRVLMTYQVAVYFKLNTDLLRQFHEQLGLSYAAYTSSGWNNLLQDTFRQNVENAVQQETRRYSVSQLYGNSQNLTQLQNSVQASLQQRLLSALGANYFCGPSFHNGGPCAAPTFIVKQIDIPQPVATAFVNQKSAEIGVAQRKAEAQAIGELNTQLGKAGMNYVLLKGIESGQITFWAIPTNSGVTLQTPNGSAGSAGSSSPSTPAAPTGSTSTTAPGP
jgi:hypothetical protein